MPLDEWAVWAVWLPPVPTTSIHQLSKSEYRYGESNPGRDIESVASCHWTIAAYGLQSTMLLKGYMVLRMGLPPKQLHNHLHNNHFFDVQNPYTFVRHTSVHVATVERRLTQALPQTLHECCTRVSPIYRQTEVPN